MEISPQNYTEAINLISSAQKILLVSHRRPDGDTLGATVALALAFSKLSKKVTPACIDEIPRRLQFITDLLPPQIRFVREFNMNDYDLIIISDAGAYHMTGFHEKYADFLSKRVPILNIDHHASNEGFGTVNLIDTKSSSATMVVWKLFKAMGVSFTKEIALALLAGIYNDTGGFIHSNTTVETFEIAGELAREGISVTDITKPLFKESTIAQLRLWGFFLENLRKNDKSPHNE
jgi:phosphoesterase RecJ-like protein